MTGKKEEISKLILNYLRKHPQAEDTFEGITRWWIEISRIEFSAADVKEALESLQKNGLVRLHKTRGGTSLYKLNSKD